jgi:ketosteroid isomerase-like protein
MSQENVDLVMSLMPAHDADLAQIVRDDELSAAMSASFAAILHPEFECVQNLFGTAKTYSGPEGLRAMLLDWLGPWATYRSEVEDTIDCGERVVVIGHAYGRHEDSEQEVSAEFADVWTVRDGRIARWEALPSRADALKAAGLEG